MSCNASCVHGSGISVEQVWGPIGYLQPERASFRTARESGSSKKVNDRLFCARSRYQTVRASQRSNFLAGSLQECSNRSGRREAAGDPQRPLQAAERSFAGSTKHMSRKQRAEVQLHRCSTHPPVCISRRLGSTLPPGISLFSTKL